LDRNDCLDFFSNDLSECARVQCRIELEALGASCAACLQSGDSVGDIFRNLDNCFSNDEIDPNQQCFAYEGQSDSLLLSTIPFDVTDTLYFAESPITVTTALYGRLTTSLGATHVFCTHLLPADLPVFTTENVTNYNQSVDLLRWVSSKVGNTSEPTILLGDFNHGPGFWPDNYDFIIQSGYTSAYTSAGNTNCTYCNSNPISMGDTSFIIDHVYLENAYQLNSSRIATYYEYNLESSRVPFIGDRIPISDHYGVRATVCGGDSGAEGVLSSQVRVTDTDTFPGRDDDSSASGMLISIATLVVLIALL
jgi:endonuclease/exonuclease/phosphatase family metal-dependent hydrolase